MTHVARASAGLLETSAREGRIARARGMAREHNPHRQPSSDSLWIFGRPDIDGMLQAWWRGWDQTDRDLRG